MPPAVVEVQLPQPCRRVVAGNVRQPRRAQPSPLVVRVLSQPTLQDQARQTPDQVAVALASSEVQMAWPDLAAPESSLLPTVQLQCP